MKLMLTQLEAEVLDLALERVQDRDYSRPQLRDMDVLRSIQKRLQEEIRKPPPFGAEKKA